MTSMPHPEKYGIQYEQAPDLTCEWLRQTPLQTPPIWCSVDLRDGNQALATPMSLDEKLRFFDLLVRLGFHEIEIGFPASNDTEYQFCRTLITENRIPDDVTVQVLTQARPHIIKKTFEAIAGAKHVIVHLYSPTSRAHREQVFHMSQEEVIALAVEGARLCRMEREAAVNPQAIRLEYSPEGFTATEPNFALRVCQAVIDAWEPTPEEPVILNLPATVEVSMPHVYANQIAFLRQHLVPADGILLSVHPHNDRGCAIADAEYGMMAGAVRVEGTLFGNGERTGNVDLITLALNFYTQGVDPLLDFSDLNQIVSEYETLTGMTVNPRQPYSGEMVFAAFSGSHQDAIAKAFSYRQSHPDDRWNAPYLPLDPDDVGREYETDVIRINSQSGKGGIAYLLQKQFGFNLPREMHLYFSNLIKSYSDRMHTELHCSQVHDIFFGELVNLAMPICVQSVHYQQTKGILATVTFTQGDRTVTAHGSGNGRLDAVSNALKQTLQLQYTLTTYTEHALADGSGAKAVSYVELQQDARVEWGVGIHTDIITSSVNALVSAINRLLQCKNARFL